MKLDVGVKKPEPKTPSSAVSVTPGYGACTVEVTCNIV
jgi:hypothetical protein